MLVQAYTPIRSDIRFPVPSRGQAAPSQDVFVASQEDPLQASRQLRAMANNPLEFALAHPNMGYTTLEKTYPDASPEDKKRIGWALGRYVADGGPRYTQDWLRSLAGSEQAVDRRAAYAGYGEVWKKGPLPQQDWNVLAARPGLELESFVEQNWERLGTEDRSRLSAALCAQMSAGTEGAYTSLRHLGLEPGAKDLRTLGPGLGQKTSESGRMHKWLEQKAEDSPNAEVREAAALALLSSKLELDHPLALAKIAEKSQDPELKKAALQRLEGPIREDEQERFDKDLAHKMEAYLNRRAGWLASDKARDPVFQLARNYWALSQADDPKYKDHVNVRQARANVGRLLQAPEVQSLREQAASDTLGRDKDTEQFGYLTSESLQVRLRLLPEGERLPVLARELGKLQQLNPQLARQAAQELATSLPEAANLPGQQGQGEGLLSLHLAGSGAKVLTKQVMEFQLAGQLLSKVVGGMSVLEAYDSFSTGDIGGGIGNSISALGTFFWPLAPLGAAVTYLAGDSPEVAQLKSLGVYR